MSRGKASGISLSNKDAAIVLGMATRGDREHDIAAWFGVNQGRIAEVKDGSHGSVGAAPAAELPPKGPPGVKGRKLRSAAARVLGILDSKKASGMDEAMVELKEAIANYDKHEA